MVWIKICGITGREDAKVVTDMGADCLGFIFSTDSPRRIELGQAREIVDAVRNIPKAGVFVNEKIGKILKYINVLGLDYVQLSGDEDISYIRELKQEISEVKIVKALRLKKDESRDSNKAIEKLLKYADHILLDSFDKYKYGGTGKTIDWEGIKGLIEPERLIVSGGLYHGNVSRALEVLRPFGADASSRLEESPGKKDLDKVQRFIKKVRFFEEQDKGK